MTRPVPFLWYRVSLALACALVVAMTIALGHQEVSTADSPYLTQSTSGGRDPAWSQAAVVPRAERQAVAPATALPAAVQVAVEAHLATPSGTITALPEGARIDHPGHQVQAIIDGQGVRVNGARIALRGVGRAGSGMIPAGAGEVRTSAERVEVWRPEVHEVYTTSRAGVRHDVVIDRRPAGAGDLVVEIACAGGRFAAKDATGAELVLADRRLTYDRLLVTDAAQRRLPATMSVVDGAVRIAVADGGARYPVVVDPTLSATGTMVSARDNHTATLMPSGKVLVTGGSWYTSGITKALSLCEVYDPTPGTWTSTGSLVTARCNHTVTLLPSGKVLVTGGYGLGFTILGSCELYDPTVGTWTATGSLAAARTSHTATLLSSGKVLVTGGYGSSGMLASCEVYDPTTGTWSASGSLATARNFHSATVLPSGDVLVAGGGDSRYIAIASCEVYDPTVGTWRTTGSLATECRFHTATLLTSGKVLVTSGEGKASSVIASCQVYDPATGTWSTTGSQTTARRYHQATLLPSGKVLVTGGGDRNSLRVASCEIFDPATGSWSSAGPLTTARMYHTATVFPSGKVLVTGGSGDGGSTIAAIELYQVTVAYDANGATGGSAPGKQVKDTGVPLTVAARGTLLRTGYSFSGWNSAANGSGTAYAEGANYTLDDTLTLYAQWTPNTATVTYDANGGAGTVATGIKIYDVLLTVASGMGFARTGYAFTGWNTAANGTGTAYAAGGSYTLNDSVMLYAQWVVAYAVTYDANGGTGTVATGIKWSGVPLTVATGNGFTRSGFTLTGWNTAVNGTGTAYAVGAAYATEADVTLYAQWQNAVEAFVTRFYQQCLNRNPDAGGLAAWAAALTNKSQSGADVARGFVLSQEFTNRNLSDSAFLDVLYTAFFNRAADAGGKAAWTAELAKGVLREDVLYGFTGAAEFANLCNGYGIIQDSADGLRRLQVRAFVRRNYQQFLGREPDAGGINGWVQALIDGTQTGGDVARGFGLSQEFINKGTTNDQFLDITYKAFFDRPADAGGKSGWLAFLAQGKTRAEVFTGFIGAQEFITLCAKYGIVPFKANG